MKKLMLDLESLGVETFATSPELVQMESEFLPGIVSRRSCIEQCSTSCVP